MPEDSDVTNPRSEAVATETLDKLFSALHQETLRDQQNRDTIIQLLEKMEKRCQVPFFGLPLGCRVDSKPNFLTIF